MKRYLAIAAIVIAGGMIGVAQAEDTSAVRTGETAAALAPGKDVFAHWCAPCHAAEPRLAGTMALQVKYEGAIPAALEDRTDLTPEVVAYFVRNGVAWMPPFRKTEISDADLAALGAYLSAPLEERGAHAPRLADEMMARKGVQQ
ncbi:mono/diheme cytochrome c family protein [Altererythrobacter atlanticus]|uniref:Cytochrome c6 n=1 Tax=Croceibacterium atlanticum TaxID=1267766 RepID=A0A0F7KY43_9SPHN|nr:cytochrome c [Croceibacterium atlanticum]AKH44137.1 Cytochrome c6 [Croceibacterium atlanticum]MBB5732447.1 mono/diheme cytochrome c family protein [Croceibacterium atlanticum]